MAPPDTVVACPDCDLLQAIPPLPPRGTARCRRCGRTLAADRPGSLDRTLALAVAASIVFLVANLDPLMGLETAGRETSTTILGGARRRWAEGERITSALVVAFVVVAPAARIGSLLAILLAARRTPVPRWAGTLLRWTEISGRWSMVEVMMLGVLVSLVKIASLATVVPSAGIFAVGALAVLLAALSVSFDPGAVWTRIRWERPEP